MEGKATRQQFGHDGGAITIVEDLSVGVPGGLLVAALAATASSVEASRWNCGSVATDVVGTVGVNLENTNTRSCVLYCWM